MAFGPQGGWLDPERRRDRRFAAAVVALEGDAARALFEPSVAGNPTQGQPAPMHRRLDGMTIPTPPHISPRKPAAPTAGFSGPQITFVTIIRELSDSGKSFLIRGCFCRSGSAWQL
jgi:hypothetical protein